jgi:hypothetical protein
MPYTCKSCGHYQQGQSADGICPAPACVATRAQSGTTAVRAGVIPGSWTLTAVVSHQVEGSSVIGPQVCVEFERTELDSRIALRGYLTADEAQEFAAQLTRAVAQARAGGT